MGVATRAQVGRRFIPLFTGVLILVLGFFAFRNGLGLTGAVTLGNTTIISSLLIDDDATVSIPVQRATVRFSSPESIRISTAGREINLTGSLELRDFDGFVAWDDEQLIAEGTMESAHGAGLDITWTRRERTFITLPSGLADVTTVNLTSFKQKVTGRMTLEGRWTANVNQTPFSMGEFEGRAYLQRVNNQTLLGLEGSAETLGLDEDNLLKILV